LPENSYAKKSFGPKNFCYNNAIPENFHKKIHVSKLLYWKNKGLPTKELQANKTLLPENFMSQNFHTTNLPTRALYIEEYIRVSFLARKLPSNNFILTNFHIRKLGVREVRILTNERNSKRTSILSETDLTRLLHIP